MVVIGQFNEFMQSCSLNQPITFKVVASITGKILFCVSQASEESVKDLREGRSLVSTVRTPRAHKIRKTLSVRKCRSNFTIPGHLLAYPSKRLITWSIETKRNHSNSTRILQSSGRKQPEYRFLQ